MNLVVFGCTGFHLSHSLHSYPEMGNGVLQECTVEITVVTPMDQVQCSTKWSSLELLVVEGLLGCTLCLLIEDL